MKLNLKLFFKTIWYSLFKAEGTPGRLTPKRLLVLTIIFFLYPIWHISIRLAYGLDMLFYPQLQSQKIEKPIFIVGNFRSGTTLLHRLLAKDDRFTGMKAWEIFLAPSITQRKLVHWLMKINHMIGNPIGKIIASFEKALKAYSYMHPTGLNKIEEDGHIFLHTWSTYNLFAFFPFPDLFRQYIYYDEKVSEEQKELDMAYYEEVLQRHIYANNGKRYISKSPTYSAKVKTLHKKFPDAKFINLVRSPLRVIPSSISMFSNHWKTYGEPETDYPQPAKNVMREQAKHWYIHPHQYLKKLPPDQYVMVSFRDLVKNPKKVIENIYKQFEIQMTREYQQILIEETEKAKQFSTNHSYSLQAMGLNRNTLSEEFNPIIRIFGMEMPKIE